MRADKIDHVSFTAFMQLNSQRQDEYQIHASSLSNHDNSGLILLTFSNITQKEKLEFIENEQRTMADVLRDISSTLNSTLDFDTILINILDQMARVVPYDSASIMLLDDDQETARIYAARGLYDQRGLIDWRKQGSLQVSQTPILRKMFLSGFPLVVRILRSNLAGLQLLKPPGSIRTLELPSKPAVEQLLDF